MAAEPAPAPFVHLVTEATGPLAARRGRMESPQGRLRVARSGPSNEAGRAGPQTPAPGRPNVTDSERAAAKHLRIRWPVVLAMLVVAIAAWFGVRRLVSSRVAPVAVTTETVSRHDITQSVDASGTVQAVEVV